MIQRKSLTNAIVKQQTLTIFCMISSIHHQHQQLINQHRHRLTLEIAVYHVSNTTSDYGIIFQIVPMPITSPSIVTIQPLNVNRTMTVARSIRLHIATFMIILLRSAIVANRQHNRNRNIIVFSRYA